MPSGDFMNSNNNPLLEVRGLVTEFSLEHGVIAANADVHIRVRAGETLGIVGESGSGKSVLCRAILRLIPSPPGLISAGEVLFDGTDLLALSEAEMRRVRGTRIKMVFQNPMTSLNPVRRIGDQITEGLSVHYGMGKAEARAEGVELLRRVGIPSPETRVREYPHQWSGGMLQRASLCRALIHEPRLLLLDEPFGALDAFTREELWGVLESLWMDRRPTVLLVTHDLREAVYLADRVVVMSARPGHIIFDRKVDIPRPRKLDDMFGDEAVQLVHDLRGKIEHLHLDDQTKELQT